jgi:hypothetical protein
MLEQINPLPGPQGKPALQDWNCELHAGQRRADMCRHVVGAFVRVPISPRLLRRQAVEKCLKIGANVRRGVLLNEQSGRGVPAKQGQEPGLHLMRLQPIQDIARNLDEPPATGRNRKNIDELAHFKVRCCGARNIGNTSLILALLWRPRQRLTQAEAKMRLIILIILIILIVGAVPAWPYSTGWGYYPAGGLGTILIIVLILALLGYL